MIKQRSTVSGFLVGQGALALLASALVVPAVAQQPATQTDSQSTSAPATGNTSNSVSTGSSVPNAAPATTTNSTAYQNADKEGFWGRMNPIAGKKWVRKRLGPMNDRLTELDEVNAKNAADIKDVDSRAQAGIQHAQSTADAANQAATEAGSHAQNATTIAQGASGHVDQINTTVNGLDQYHQVSDVDLPFHGATGMLSKDAKEQLDQLATSLAGHQGYILEMEARSPGAGAVGIQNSQKLAESVERYLLTEHQIPVYRMHFVALGNAPAAAEGDAKPARVTTSSVHIRLMENSLAAQDSASPHGVASTTGAERP